MKKYIPPAVVFAVTALALWAMLAAQGCAISDYITVKVDPKVQKATGSPSKVTLTEAPGVLAEYDDDYQRGRAAFTGAIEDGKAMAGFLGSFVDIGMDYGTVTIKEAAVPGGAILTTILGSIGGVLLGRTNKQQAVKDVLTKAQQEALEKLREQEKKSFNKGLEEGKRIATA